MRASTRPHGKPKGSRNIIVDGRLYWWETWGSDSDPNGYGIWVIDSVTREYKRTEWANVSDIYPIMPRAVSAWIEKTFERQETDSRGVSERRI